MLKFILATTLLWLATGCVRETPASGDAMCEGTRRARADLAAALVLDGGDGSVVAGDRLITLIDAACSGS